MPFYWVVFCFGKLNACTRIDSHVHVQLCNCVYEFSLCLCSKSFTAYDIKVFDTSDEESLASFNLSSSVDDVLTLALKLFIATISHDQPFLEVTTDSGSFFVAIDALNNIQVTFDR